MKKIYLTLVFVAFASFLFVNCDSDDAEEIIEVIIEEPDPFELEGELAGADAVNILTEAVYTSLTIEFAYVEGDRPRQASLDELKDFINARAHKSGGITFVETVIPVQTGAPYTQERLGEIEVEHRTQFRSDTNIAFWIFMVNEQILGDNGELEDGVLAAVYTNTSMYMSIPVMMVAAEQSPISGYDGVESSTLQHEFGHWIGLVNTLGTGDPVHPTDGEHESTGDGKAHCKVETCLMWFGTNLPFHGGYLEMLQKGITIIELDALCLADLQALGGK